MPARYGHASSSRAAQSQVMDLDDDDDDEVVYEMNGNGGDDAEGAGDEGEGWTQDTFIDRPMTHTTAGGQLQKLKTKTSEAMRQIDDDVEHYAQVAAAVADCDPKHESLKAIQSHALRLLNVKQELQIKYDVLKTLEERLKRGEHMMNIQKEYEDALRSKLDEWSAQTDRARYRKNNKFEQYQKTIWAKTHPDDPLPPMSRFLPRTEGDESDDDDDIEEGGTMVSYRCPLSYTVLKDAHTSDLCGHSYTGEHIMYQLNRLKRKPLKCPQAGCGAQLTKDVVRPDPALQKKADEWVKRQEQLQRETAYNDDDDDVVENE